MDESDVLVLLLAELRSLTSAPVFLEGSGDERAESPSVSIEDYFTTPLPNRNGARKYAGTIVDDQTGEEIGKEYHFYFEFSADVIVREDTEEARDDLLATILQHFGPHADDPRGLHADLCELEIGSASARSVPFREPDWFEGGRDLRLVYLTRVTTGGDTLETIDRVIDPDFTVSRDI